MELKLVVELIQGVFYFLGFLFLIKTIIEIKEVWMIKGDNDAKLFAYNTVHNHARISGLFASGDVSHKKCSVGAAGLRTEVLNEPVDKDKSVTIRFKKDNPNFTFIPQSKLNAIS